MNSIVCTYIHDYNTVLISGIIGINDVLLKLIAKLLDHEITASFYKRQVQHC